MLVNLLHGGNRLDVRDGFNGGKPGRHIFGTGLYTTNSIDWIMSYGRTQYSLECDLDPAKSSENVEISIDSVLEFIYVNCTKKLYTQAKKDFSNRESLSCARLEVYLVNNCRSFSKIALALNNFFVVNGCTHSVEIAGSFNAWLFNIYDFSVIKNVDKVKNYNDTEIPKELQKDYKRYA